MPGSLVTDALAPNLLAGATLTAAGASNGTIVQLDRPSNVAFVLTMGAVTGTSPTISVSVQGSDSPTFASGVVTYGTVSAAAVANAVRLINAHVYHRYVRASTTLGGTTPNYAGSTLYATQPHLRRVRETTAA